MGDHIGRLQIALMVEYSSEKQPNDSRHVMSFPVNEA